MWHPGYSRGWERKKLGEGAGEKTETAPSDTKRKRKGGRQAGKERREYRRRRGGCCSPERGAPGWTAPTGGSHGAVPGKFLPRGIVRFLPVLCLSGPVPATRREKSGFRVGSKEGTGGMGQGQRGMGCTSSSSQGPVGMGSLRRMQGEVKPGRTGAGEPA